MNKDQSKSQNTEQNGWMEVFAGAVIATVFVSIWYVIKWIAFPLLKWIAKKIWSGISNRKTEPKTEISTKSELPTPDCFKGMTNLAPAKEFNL